jgi:hypothetical protein
VIGAVRITSQDPDLDLLLIRFPLESGARRGCALNLRMFGSVRFSSPLRQLSGGTCRSSAMFARDEVKEQERNHVQHADNHLQPDPGA